MVFGLENLENLEKGWRQGLSNRPMYIKLWTRLFYFRKFNSNQDLTTFASFSFLKVSPHFQTPFNKNIHPFQWHIWKSIQNKIWGLYFYNLHIRDLLSFLSSVIFFVVIATFLNNEQVGLVCKEIPSSDILWFDSSLMLIKQEAPGNSICLHHQLFDLFASKWGEKGRVRKEK